VLQSLELQHAAGMPHRAITPDTIAIQENGEAVLLPGGRTAAEQSVPADLQALAAVIHYAITLELAPQAPLRGRRLEGYSDSLVNAVDKCMSPDPRQRPQTIDALRNLLGIVAVGASSPAPRSKPDSAAPAVPVLAHGSAPSGRLRRWLLIGAAATVLLMALIALLALLRGTASRDAVVLSLPPQQPNAAGPEPSQTPAQAVATEPAPAARAEQMLGDEPPRPAREPSVGRPVDTAPNAAAATPRRAPPAAAPAVTTYKLMVKPWGTVYVDGQERGVSPPLKRLALPAGQHTVRLVNPNFRDRVLRVDAGKSPSGTIVHDFSAR
jgi:hypothetical protein